MTASGRHGGRIRKQRQQTGSRQGYEPSKLALLVAYFSSKALPPRSPQVVSVSGEQVFKCLRLWRTQFHSAASQGAACMEPIPVTYYLDTKFSGILTQVSMALYLLLFACLQNYHVDYTTKFC